MQVVKVALSTGGEGVELEDVCCNAFKGWWGTLFTSSTYYPGSIYVTHQSSSEKIYFCPFCGVKTGGMQVGDRVRIIVSFAEGELGTLVNQESRAFDWRVMLDCRSSALGFNENEMEKINESKRLV